MNNLIYIYNPIQAEFILREIKAEGLYRIGKGNQGDICVSFFDTQKVREANTLWNKRIKTLN